MNCTPSLSNSLMSVRQFITDQRGCITRYYLTHCVSQTQLHLTLLLHCTAHTTHTASHCTHCSAMLCTVRTVASTDVQCNALYLYCTTFLHSMNLSPTSEVSPPYCQQKGGVFISMARLATRLRVRVAANSTLHMMEEGRIA